VILTLYSSTPGMFKLPIVSPLTALVASNQVHCAGDTNCRHCDLLPPCRTKVIEQSPLISQCKTSWIKAMNNMAKARALLTALPRCTAKSRQSGVQCKNPGLGSGGKCRFHGGASTGRPPIHGRLTKANLLNRDWVRLLLGPLG